ncbi:MAG: hypothetical protein DHS80DRAFT_21026 [Piptocephalis tieghemiana]|nr:MAG: hypothetical protein DHS80DRAFT_21026 [Piptocephalis tieghemiana]
MTQAISLPQAISASLSQATAVQAPREVLEGLRKLQRLVRTEMSREEQKSREGGNLGYLQAVYQCAALYPGLVGLLVPQTLPSRPGLKFRIDLVTHWGNQWVKVSWRRPDALARQLTLAPSPGLPWPREADFFHTVQEALDALHHRNMHRILPISLHVHLPRGTSSSIQRMLLDMGVAHIHLSPLPESLSSWSFPDLLSRFPLRPSHALLDTTTLMALVSDACHLPPHLHPSYPIKAMRLQVDQEANGPFPPLLPSISFVLQGVQSIRVLHSSLCAFLSILRVMGGKDEIARAVQLFPSFFPSLPTSSPSSTLLPSPIIPTDETITSHHDFLLRFPDALLLTANRRLAQRYQDWGGRIWSHPPRSLCQIARLTYTSSSSSSSS